MLISEDEHQSSPELDTKRKIVPEIYRIFSIDSEDEKNTRLNALRAAKRETLLRLFKTAVCDFTCLLFVLRHWSFKRQRLPMLWCGAAGVIASLISIRAQWTKVTGTRLTDYPVLVRKEFRKFVHVDDHT